MKKTTLLLCFFWLCMKVWSQDIEISLAYMLSTMKIETHDFSAFDDKDACELFGDKCTYQGIQGVKKLLAFGLKSINVGTATWDLGKTPKNKESQGYFVWSECHRHHHFTGFVKYDLFDLCNNVRAGKKLGGAVYDCADPDDTHCSLSASSWR